MPNTPLASLLAHIINYPSEHFRLASLAILTLLIMTSVGIKVLSSKCPHFFGNT